MKHFDPILECHTSCDWITTGNHTDECVRIECHCDTEEFTVTLTDKEMEMLSQAAKSPTVRRSRHRKLNSDGL